MARPEPFESHFFAALPRGLRELAYVNDRNLAKQWRFCDGKPGRLQSLTPTVSVGIIANVEARLLFRFRRDYDDGAIAEAVIWELPRPMKGSQHAYKYRLFYGFPGKRVVGYDNERGKGDHRHFYGRESRYAFNSVDRLIEDFIKDVEQRRKDDAHADDPD